MWDIDTHIGMACIAVPDPWEGCGTASTAASRTARTHPRYGSVNTFGSDTVGLPDR